MHCGQEEFANSNTDERDILVPIQTGPRGALHCPTGGGCRNSSCPRSARFGAAGVHPHTSQPTGLHAPLAVANCANLVRIFEALNTYAVNNLALMSPTRAF